VYGYDPVVLLLDMVNDWLAAVEEFVYVVDSELTVLLVVVVSFFSYWC